MEWCRQAVALWCALAFLAGDRARAYTVDCNHDYADCETELSKIANEDDELLIPSSTTTKELHTSTQLPIVTTPKIEVIVNKSDLEFVTEPKGDIEPKPKARLLNLNVDELQNFANVLHNQSNEKISKKVLDLSDVTLDDDEDDPPKILSEHKLKTIPDKFYSNLQAPFHHLLNNQRRSEELESCRENGVFYKIGDRMDRGCEESCECSPGGVFDCSPRCKHPYIRRGRRLDDPLCFESPVDDCCSIIACATGTSEVKQTKVEVCRYGNDTYAVGSKWHVRCEQTCTCDANSIVTCKPRCSPVSLSDKCINVQDPNDACCEVQVCDVSQDVHEEPENTTSSSTTTTTEGVKNYEYFDQPLSTRRPLVLIDPIGSVKVLHNNSVQVNLMNMNNTENPIHLLLSSDGGKSYEDIELKYSNLILDLKGGKDYILKTKETGTKFNFTITASDSGANEVSKEGLADAKKVGCFEDGKLYAVGEEFHIGCTELCECTGPETRECAALACPSHVGLELVSKGCVRWEPSPPAHPPNCCPRSARCLSDGTCHFKAVPIPNWSEVPISLTGCEQRCFCENGELDCQEVCSPLPAVPPQSFRCPPLHRPAHVNISDEDCCKQWGCIPNAKNNGSTLQIYSMPTLGEADINFVTPLAQIHPTISTLVLSPPPVVTDSIDYYRHLTPVKSFPKYLKSTNPASRMNIFPKNVMNKDIKADANLTVFTLADIDKPFKSIQAEGSVIKNNAFWNAQSEVPDIPIVNDSMIENTNKIHIGTPYLNHVHSNLINCNSRLPNIIHSSRIHSNKQISVGPYKVSVQNHETSSKDPVSLLNHMRLFLSNHDHIKTSAEGLISKYDANLNNAFLAYTKKPTVKYFKPDFNNNATSYIDSRILQNLNINSRGYPISETRKHVTILRTKDLKPIKTINNILHDEAVWSPDIKNHVLTKKPNPYETVLYRVIPDGRTQFRPMSNQNVKVSRPALKTYSSLDLERLLTQMEVESEVNRNLGRSADKNHNAAGQLPAPGIPPQVMHRPQQPPFIPTIPPDVHFSQQDLPDYDENNIQHPRPTNPLEPGLPNIPGLIIPTNFGDVNKKLTVISIESDSPSSVKMLFGLPPVLVGLRGSVDLRYTDQADQDISNWNSQVFAPEDEILTTNRLDFRLTGLKPSTVYKIRGKLYLHNLPVEPESDIYSVQTQDLPTLTPTVEEKRRVIKSKLIIVDVNDTSAQVSWRHFTEDELQYIDGIQVRYRPVGTPIYSMTELLHHSRSAAELHDLHPNNTYEASLVLIPPPRAVTELYDPGHIEFTTLPLIDPYNWPVVVEARTIGSEAVELTWSGIPSPAERWVRVYRAAHACGSPAQVGNKREHDAFRLATRDLPPTVLLNGLEPDSRCRVWLELFLTNGKIKTSNVLEINTKSLDSPEPIDNEIESASVAGGRGGPRGDYYGALVVVGVVAALGALTSILLLLVVVRRHRPRSVSITPMPTAPRESSLPPYDNPAYKLELQQETMDL